MIYSKSLIYSPKVLLKFIEIVIKFIDWGSIIGVASLRAGRSGFEIEKGFPEPVQIGTYAHPASCKMGTGVLSRE